MIRVLLCSLLAFFSACRSAASEDRKFTIENDLFLLDGKPFRILSGRCVNAFLPPPQNLSPLFDPHPPHITVANQLIMLLQSALS